MTNAYLRWVRRVAIAVGSLLCLAPPAVALDQEARLAEAASAYATALAEPDRDVRLAGFARAQRGVHQVAVDRRDLHFESIAHAPAP